MNSNHTTHRQNTICGCILILLMLASSTWAKASGEHGHNHHEHGHDEEQVSEISPTMSLANGIKTRLASGGLISQKIKVYGRLQASPEHMAKVQARFPGVVKSIAVNIGDTVKKGQQLAVIESNNSFQNYTITAPINGMIQHRFINPGEYTSDRVLLNILNSESLWAELKIFHQQRKQVRSGQAITVWDKEKTINSQIHHIIPGPTNEPYLLARVPFDNHDKKHTPGDLISADIIVASHEVAVMVENTAIQMLDGVPVVFTQNGTTYEPVAVTLGPKDDQHTAIIEGLKAGQSYVARNSYLIKADIEKSAAGHSH